MKSSFRTDDVTLLLKDITGRVNPLSTEEREKRIQNGMHYSEMLPIEYRPSDDYIRIYNSVLKTFGQVTADAIARVADRIVQRKGDNVVIVSLARAGTPLGILIRRYIKKKYNLICSHYSISIIRDKGIDRNALKYILDKHNPRDIQFVDGWTGKGVIYKELKSELSAINCAMDDRLAVVADPAFLTDLCGTHEDIIIPSSCLNSTVCGLISRTFLNKEIINKNDFHGAAYYGELATEDRTYEFIDYIEKLFKYNLVIEDEETKTQGIEEVKKVASIYNITNLNYIKPGIGETTRVLLRRVPWKVLINRSFIDSPELEHIVQLAKEKQVDIEYLQLDNFKCCGLIKQLTDV